jgi:deazaflavin-dependent oxidoreductase (nitroreductase family)
MADLESLSGEPFCYVTSRGRLSGRPHTIEIWFAIEGRTLYMLSGGGDRSDWVRNVLRKPEVSVRIGGDEIAGRGRMVAEGEEDALARRLLLAKYEPGYAGDLSEWGRTALPVAIDLEVVA